MISPDSVTLPRLHLQNAPQTSTPPSPHAPLAEASAERDIDPKRNQRAIRSIGQRSLLAQQSVQNQLPPPPPKTSMTAADAIAQQALIEGLTKTGELQKHQYYGTERRLRSLQITLPPDSYIARKNNLVEGQSMSAERYIQVLGLPLPTNWQETLRLAHKIAMPLPAPPAQGDFGGLLGRAVPLTQPQQDRVRAIVNDSANTHIQSLITHAVANTQAPATPRKVLEQLIANPQAQALGQKLEAELQGISTPTSVNEWLMTAVALQLGITPETQRNRIAGYDLNHPDNWGKPASAIIAAVNDHLERENANFPDVRGYLLLLRVAPQFLVKQLPENLVYGSNEWAVFSAAVSRIEQQAPGTAATMTFDQVIEFGNTSAASEPQAVHAALAQRNAMVDWGIVNGFLVKNDDDIYDPAAIDHTQGKFNQQIKELSTRLAVFSSPLPTRKALAEVELKKVLGDDVPLEKEFIKLGRQNRGGKAYSIIDLYMSGRLKTNTLRSDSDKALLRKIEPKFDALPDIKKVFKETFTPYFDGVKNAFTSRIKSQISRLPLEDRKNFQFGGLTAYSVRRPLHEDSDDNISQKQYKNTGRGCLLFKTVRDEKVTYYEFSVSDQTIRKKTDLPDELPIGAPSIARGVDGDKYSERFTRLPFDLDKYGIGHGGIPPSKVPVIIDPVRIQLTSGSSGADEPNSTTAPLKTFFTTKTDAIAKTVSEHFFSDKVSFQADAFGETNFEKLYRENNQLNNSILNVIIPFKSAIENAIEGKWDDAIGDAMLDLIALYNPGAKGSGIVNRTSRKTAMGLLTGVKKFGGAVLKDANLFADVADLTRLLTKGAKSAASSLSDGIHSLQISGRGLLTAPNGLDSVSMGTFKYQGDVMEGAAAFKDNKWYALDPLSLKPYGPPLEDFLPSLQAQTAELGKWATADRPRKTLDEAVVKSWKKTVNDHRTGPQKAQFESGYQSGNPHTIKGFSNSMEPADIITLAGNKNLTAKEVGMLLKRFDDLSYQMGRVGSARFIDAIEPGLGSVIPMPQVIYLSKTGQLSDGQCAALSRVMADAMAEGKEQLLIKNMLSAAAYPADPASREFAAKLSKIQTQVGARSAFHAQQTVRQETVQGIVNELADASVSKSIMIDSPGHAMAAGVRVDDTAKSFYFYDPNHGLATFSNAQDMEKALEKLTHDKKLKPGYVTHSTDPTKLEFKVFDHTDAWQRINSVPSTDVKKLYDVPLAIRPDSEISAEKFMVRLLNERLATPGTKASVRTLEALKKFDFAVPTQIYRGHTATGDTLATGLRRAAGTDSSGDDYLAAIIQHTARTSGSGGEVMSFSASKAKANSFATQYSTPTKKVPVFTVDTTQDPDAFRTVVDIVLKDGERLVRDKKITKATLLQAVEKLNGQELEVFYVKGDIPPAFMVS